MNNGYFVLTNDPDHGRYDDYLKVLKKLSEENILITTAVFCDIKNDNSKLSEHCNLSDTHGLSNNKYRDLMLEARDYGHEIAFHGFSQTNDKREEFIKGIEIYEKVFGELPYTYIEHGGHMKTHEEEMVTNQNLSKYGMDENSKNYIFDIIKDVFKLVWTHEFLDDEKPVRNEYDAFEYRDGIKYFYRTRMHNYNEKIIQLNKLNNIFIGYTHFGYKGYKSRFNKIRNIINYDSCFSEWWTTSSRDLNRVIERIKMDIERYRLKSITIKELDKIHCE